MTLSLYSAGQDLQNKIAICVDEDGVIDIEKMHAIEAKFNDKAVAVIAYMLNLKAESEAIDAHIAQVYKHKSANDAKIEKMERYLSEQMKATGTTEIKANDGTFKAKLYLDRDESVLLEDGAEFPPELCNPVKPPPPPTPSKKLIKAAIERGEPVKGASIVRKDRLTIS